MRNNKKQELKLIFQLTHSEFDFIINNKISKCK